MPASANGISSSPGGGGGGQEIVEDREFVLNGISISIWGWQVERMQYINDISINRCHEDV